MELSLQQQRDLGNWCTSWVLGNKYLISALNVPQEFIRITDSASLEINLNALDQAYQEKFVSNNPDLYSVQLMLKLKPWLTTYLRNEGIRSHNFDFIFLYAGQLIRKSETISVYNPS